MSRLEDAPFRRGETYFNGEQINAPPTGEFLGGYNYEGHEYDFLDEWYGSGLNIRVRVLRNSSAYNLLPGQLVTFTGTRVLDSSPVLLGTNAGAVAATEAAYCLPVDELLPAGGVPSGDLFYAVVSGPCLLTTAKSPASGNVNIAIGQKVVSCTGSATTDGNEGAVIGQDLSAATTGPETTIANQINNAVGRALSATTTAQTGTAILVAIGW